jgi:hypothetical protein
MSFALDGCGKSEHWSIQVVLENELQLELLELVTLQHHNMM